MSEQPTDGSSLLERAAGGDQEAARALLSGQRDRLKRLVRLRLSRDLAGRVDESKVVDDILMEAAGRLAAYAGDRGRPLSLWVRDLACRKLAELQGGPLHDMSHDAVATAIGDLTLHAGGLPVADARKLAARMRGKAVDSDAADRTDRRVYLQEIINSLEWIDREVIALKHFERLGFAEIAEVLGLTEAEAGRRYLGAIRRLREVLPWSNGPRRP
jgi:RNA polymerase sigma-70 factor (ECF subfamily)